MAGTLYHFWKSIPLAGLVDYVCHLLFHNMAPMLMKTKKIRQCSVLGPFAAQVSDSCLSLAKQRAGNEVIRINYYKICEYGIIENKIYLACQQHIQQVGAMTSSSQTGFKPTTHQSEAN